MNFSQFLLVLLTLILVSAVGYVILFTFCSWWVNLFRGLSSPSGGPGGRHVRGAQLIEGGKLKPKNGKRDKIIFGSVGLPPESETLGTLLSGAPGSGKSVAIHEAIRTIRDRGQRAVILDPTGEFMASWFRPGDVILNPLDFRSESWSPLAEITFDSEIKSVVKSLIPDGSASEKEWNGYAQAVCVAVLKSGQVKSNYDLVRLLCTADATELATLCAGTTAAPLFSPDNARMLGSIRAIVGAQIGPLENLKPGAGKDGFSVKKWISNEKQNAGQILWIPFLPQHRDELRPIVSSLISNTVAGLMSLPPSRERKLFFVLDELASLGDIQMLSTLVSETRKFGGCTVAAIQSIAQMRQIYSKDGAQALFSCFSNWLIFKAPDAETAEYMSAHLGDSEVMRASSSSKKMGESASTSTNLQKTRLVMPSDIQSLPALRGIASFSGVGHAQSFSLTISERPQTTEPFIPR